MAKKTNREKILAHAARLFSRKGYQGTSMRDVASAAKVTLPTIYHYFGSKRNLYDEARIGIFNARSNKHMKHLFSDEEPSRQVHDYLLALATDLMNDPLYYKLLHREMLEQDKTGLKRLSEESFKPGFEKMCEVLSKMSIDRPPPKMTMTLYSLLFGLISTMRYGVFLDDSLLVYQTPEYLVRLTLERLIPEIDWPAAA